MAVQYKLEGNFITIGGEINPTTGLAGPFPRYSVSREPIKKDTLHIANKYTINITGTALINTGSTSSMLDAGERQNDIHDIIGKILFFQAKQGVLEIAPYGGKANILRFDDAILVNCEAVEQTDTSQGVQSQDYNFTFEAYSLTIASENVDNTIETFDPEQASDIFNLEDFSESWEYSIADENTQLEFELDDTTKKVFRNYTITHTLSAKGRPKQPSPGEDPKTKSGYIEAKAYVDKWLAYVGNNPIPALPAIVPDHSRGEEQDVNLKEIIQGEDSELYAAYNQLNTYSKDILEGTYSVTRTWTVSRHPATCTIDLSLNEDPAAEFNTVELSINIDGHEYFLEGETIDKTTTRKYVSAKSFFDDSVKPIMYTIANSFHKDRLGDPPERPLRTTASSFNQTHNQTSGTISVSATYDDAFTPAENVLTHSINITSNNEDGGNNIVAILQVISKADGPIIQNMNTTQERTRSISMDWVMAKSARVLKPSRQAEAYIEANYKPDPDNVYRQSKTETWNPLSGAYNVSIDYVWTKDTPNN